MRDLKECTTAELRDELDKRYRRLKWAVPCCVFVGLFIGIPASAEADVGIFAIPFFMLFVGGLVPGVTYTRKYGIPFLISILHALTQKVNYDSLTMVAAFDQLRKSWGYNGIAIGCLLMPFLMWFPLVFMYLFFVYAAPIHYLYTVWKLRLEYQTRQKQDDHLPPP